MFVRSTQLDVRCNSTFPSKPVEKTHSGFFGGPNFGFCRKQSCFPRVLEAPLQSALARTKQPVLLGAPLAFIADSRESLLNWLQARGPEPAPPHPAATCRDGRPAHILTSPGFGPRRVGLRGLARVRDVTSRGGPGWPAPGCSGSFLGGRSGWGRGGGGAGGVNRPGSREPRRRRGRRRHGLPAAGRCRGEVVFQHAL